MNFNSALTDAFHSFELLRPYWLIGIIIIIALNLWRYQRNKGQYSDIIASHLSKHLVTEPETTKNNRFLLNCLAVVACFALSGPSIRSVDIPVFEVEKAQVIALDLTYSMYSSDIKPNRLSQAKYKAIDLIKQLPEGDKALIAYAGDAFTIAPLTQDGNAIINHIPHLSPGLMPVTGSRPDIALEKSISLLTNAGYQEGHIIFITDGFDANSAHKMETMLKDSQWIVSILAVATDDGAPIKMPDGSLLKDNNGNIVIPKLQSETLYPVARISDGLYLPFSLTSQDIDQLSYYYDNPNKRKEVDKKNAAENKQLIDDGYWLTLLLIPLFLLLFRKGVFYAALFAFTLPLTTPKVEASIWKNNEQNAYQLYQDGEFKAASEAFKNPNWKATALFKDKKYKEAESIYQQQATLNNNNAELRYNLGNAQAMQQKYKEALASYDEALDIDPTLEAAKKNKKLVEELLKQQEQQTQEQQNQEQSDSDQNQEQSDSDQNQGQQNQEQQSQEQPDSDQNQEQQKQEQSNADQDQQSQEQQNQEQSNADQEQQSQEQQKQEQSNVNQEQKSQEQQKQEQPDSKQEQQNQEQKTQNQSEENQEKSLEEQEKSDPAQAAKEQEKAQQALQSAEETDENKDYEALPNWVKNMSDDPYLLLRNKMRLEYQKRMSNKTTSENNNGEIW